MITMSVLISCRSQDEVSAAVEEDAEVEDRGPDGRHQQHQS
jgi:hypothetical protein